MAMGLEGTHTKFMRQIEGLLVVGSCLRGISGVSVGIENTKLVQRDCLVPTCLLLPGHVDSLTRVLPGLLATSRQTTDLAEPCDEEGMIARRIRAETFADRLLQQRPPLREASLERRGIAKARREPWQLVAVPGGAAEGETRLQHPDGVLQVPLGEVQLAEACVGND